MTRTHIGTLKLILAVGSLLALSGVAEAHPGHAGDLSFAAGFAHPLSGWDHMIAMLAVGFAAARMGGRALWALPAAFIGVMMAGFAWAVAGQGLGWVEEAILASVVALPVLALAARKVALWPALAVTGGFALFHGYAHGLERVVDGSTIGFLAGFALATAVLHFIGLAVGLMAARRFQSA